jgi:hypothetical protein
MGVGMSTDVFTKRDITRKIFSSTFRDYCPNIIDLYAKLTLGEGYERIFPWFLFYVGLNIIFFVCVEGYVSQVDLISCILE